MQYTFHLVLLLLGEVSLISNRPLISHLLSRVSFHGHLNIRLLGNSEVLTKLLNVSLKF